MFIKIKKLDAKTVVKNDGKCDYEDNGCPNLMEYEITYALDKKYPKHHTLNFCYDCGDVVVTEDKDKKLKIMEGK